MLENVDGIPLLLRQTQAACKACDTVVVVLKSGQTERAECLKDTAARVVFTAGTSMSVSLKCGVDACETTHALIALADMPDITTEDHKKLIAMADAYPKDIIRATTQQGRHGHPVVFPQESFADFQSLRGDTGAKRIIEKYGVRPCPLPGERAITDLDTPEDWDAWRAAR